MQRRILRHGSFDSIEVLYNRVLDFVRYWSRYEAHPFRWTFNGKFVQTPEHLAAWRSVLMPKLAADPIDVMSVESYLEEHTELAHLRVRKRGALLVLESGPPGDAIVHARLRRATKQWWTPELPSHTGSWSPLPARLPILDALDLLRTDFAWVLTPQE